jgi:hypothetical protein
MREKYKPQGSETRMLAKLEWTHEDKDDHDLRFFKSAGPGKLYLFATGWWLQEFQYSCTYIFCIERIATSLQ